MSVLIYRNGHPFSTDGAIFNNSNGNINDLKTYRAVKNIYFFDGGSEFANRSINAA